MSDDKNDDDDYPTDADGDQTDKFAPERWEERHIDPRWEEVGRYWRRVEKEVLVLDGRRDREKRKAALEALVASDQYVIHRDMLKEAIEDHLRNEGLLESNEEYKAFDNALKAFCQIGLVRRLPKLAWESNRANFLTISMQEWFRQQRTLQYGEPTPKPFPSGQAACIVHYITQAYPDPTDSIPELVASEADLYAKAHQYVNIQEPSVELVMGSLETVEKDATCAEILHEVDFEFEFPKEDQWEDRERVHNYTIAGEIRGASLNLRPPAQLDIDGVDEPEDVKRELKREIEYWLSEITMGVHQLYPNPPQPVTIDEVAEEVAGLWNEMMELKQKQKEYGGLTGVKRYAFNADVSHLPERIPFASYVRKRMEKA